MSLNWCTCCCLHCYCCLHFTTVSAPVCYQNQSGLLWVNWSVKPVMRFTNSSNFSKHITSTLYQNNSTILAMWTVRAYVCHFMKCNIQIQLCTILCPNMDSSYICLQGQWCLVMSCHIHKQLQIFQLHLMNKTSTYLSWLAYYCLCLPVPHTGKMIIYTCFLCHEAGQIWHLGHPEPRDHTQVTFSVLF